MLFVINVYLLYIFHVITHGQQFEELTESSVEHNGEHAQQSHLCLSRSLPLPFYNRAKQKGYCGIGIIPLYKQLYKLDYQISGSIY
jgi:hypothetical protein